MAQRFGVAGARGTGRGRMRVWKLSPCSRPLWDQRTVTRTMSSSSVHWVFLRAGEFFPVVVAFAALSFVGVFAAFAFGAVFAGAVAGFALFVPPVGGGVLEVPPPAASS